MRGAGRWCGVGATGVRGSGVCHLLSLILSFRGGGRTGAVVTWARLNLPAPSVPFPSADFCPAARQRSWYVTARTRAGARVRVVWRGCYRSRGEMGTAAGARRAVERADPATTGLRCGVRGVLDALAGGEAAHLLGRLESVLLGLVDVLEDQRHRLDRQVAAGDEPFMTLCSIRSAPASRITAWSLGKMPTTSVRRRSPC